MSTRRTSQGLSFDHGCQYFSASDRRFVRCVTAWRTAGIVDSWQGRAVELDRGVVMELEPTTTRYVGVPGMNAVCKHLAAGLDVRCGIRVDVVRRVSECWRLSDAVGAELGSFEAVIVAVPSTQSVDLLEAAPRLAQVARSAAMTSCWAVMAAFAEPVPFPADAVAIRNSSLVWVARNSSKPHRNHANDCWVLQASADWSKRHLHRDRAWVAKTLVDEFAAELGISAMEPIHVSAHRWKYGMPENFPTHAKSLLDRQLQIGVCGDWCQGNRVEAAYLSGLTIGRETSRLLWDESSDVTNVCV